MVMQTFVIKRKTNEDGKSKTYYFQDYMFSLPRWGDLKDAMKFSTKDTAKYHLPGLRNRITAFGRHYTKGIKVVEAFKTGKLWYIIEKNSVIK